MSRRFKSGLNYKFKPNAESVRKYSDEVGPFGVGYPFSPYRLIQQTFIQSLSFLAKPAIYLSKVTTNHFFMWDKWVYCFECNITFLLRKWWIWNLGKVLLVRSSGQIIFYRNLILNKFEIDIVVEYSWSMITGLQGGMLMHMQPHTVWQTQKHTQTNTYK